MAGLDHFFRYAFQPALQAHARFAAHNEQIDGVGRPSPNRGDETPTEPRQNQSWAHTPITTPISVKTSRWDYVSPKNSAINKAAIGNKAMLTILTPIQIGRAR